MYPVERTLLSLTMTAPTLRLMHVERDETRRAMFMKYSSLEGLCIPHVIPIILYGLLQKTNRDGVPRVNMIVTFASV